MFFDLISRNSKRNRKENGLFFSSLLISIIAFYLILSLENQDVMKFLMEMESDAVNRLFSMVPLFYVMTLFILFFLIYFASKYQLDCRRHEFGMYQMMGMRRSKLFFLLLAEDIRNSVSALIIGLPVGIAVAEVISLITARLVGLGIVGHTFSFSLKAALLTVIGFLFIKLVAFLILSKKIAGQEIGDLLQPKPIVSKKQLPYIYHIIAFIGGAALLCVAYACGISGFAWKNLGMMAFTLFSGTIGTFLFFFGISSFIEKKLKRRGKENSLHIFTFRQLQEEVVRKSNTIAVSSLLILAALCCFGSGVAIAAHYGKTENYTIDYAFLSDEPYVDVSAELEKNNLDHLFSDLFEMRVAYIKTEDDNYEGVFSMDDFMNAIEEYPDFSGKDILINNLGYQDYPYLISLSGYNKLLEIAEKNPIELEDNEAALYMDSEYATDSISQGLNHILSSRPEVMIQDDVFYLTNTIQSTNLVVDRSITLSFALIVSDETFDRISYGGNTLYTNGVLDLSHTEGKSLMNAIMDTNKLLNQTGLHYESYIQNMGRQLFYVVAASYITIYLSIVFLIIANTVIGIQFLTREQETSGRYKSLIRIGADYATLKESARSQINWSFGMPVIVAAISSLFGIRTLFAGLLSTFTGSDLYALTLISCAMILLLCVIECIYMAVVKKSSDRYLLTLMTLEREE